MKALIITGSRADLNCQTVVHEALLKAGHDSIISGAGTYDEGGADDRDVAIVAGDRIEILETAVNLAKHRLPIAHISGGDVTEGSADNRYRDAITALASIHFTETEQATERLEKWLHFRLQGARGDRLYLVGCPGLDLVRQTPINPDKADVLSQFCMKGDKPVALVCVHPDTVGPEPMVEAWAVCAALSKLEMQCICLGANADRGGEQINAMWRDWCGGGTEPMRSFHANVPPQVLYNLMTHCDVMVGNSSAMLTEAPCFGLNCVMVGDRQKRRPRAGNVVDAQSMKPEVIARLIMTCIIAPRYQGENPYGDGNAGPRIVKALEENAWRWTTK